MKLARLHVRVCFCSARCNNFLGESTMSGEENKLKQRQFTVFLYIYSAKIGIKHLQAIAMHDNETPQNQCRQPMLREKFVRSAM